MNSTSNITTATISATACCINHRQPGASSRNFGCYEVATHLVTYKVWGGTVLPVCGRGAETALSEREGTCEVVSFDAVRYDLDNGHSLPTWVEGWVANNAR